jgi:cystathionine beta-lyase/cystathionine gamma-synthase
VSELALETRAARAGVARPLLPQVASAPPLHPSVTWLLPTQQALEAALSEGNAFVYARNANPTVALFEEAVGDLEGGEAVAFASGQAALHAALLSLDLRPGDHVAFAHDCYGMTRTLLLELSASAGVRPLTVRASEPEQVSAALRRRERVRALVVEAIANPLVRVADLPALAAIAHRRGAALVVDATLATPLLVRPLEHGADLVVHSATKFLAGHGDVVAGVVCGRGERLATVRRLAQVVGGVLGRSKPGSRCAGCARSRCGWSASVRMPPSWRAGWPSSRPSHGCTTPASRTILTTRWPAVCLAASASVRS